jgi:hypothetical protein
VAKPPLGLSVVSIAADGSEQTWWSGDKYAYNRPQQLSFRNRIGEGFSDGGPRSLVGSIATTTTSSSTTTSWSWATTARSPTRGASARRRARPRAVTRSASRRRAGWPTPRTASSARSTSTATANAWQPMGTTRRANMLAGGYRITDHSTGTDSANNQVALVMTHALAGNSKPITEAWYDAGPELKIGYVYYDYNEVNTQVGSQPRVYGDHGLTRRMAPRPGGFYASDVITNIAQRFCPKLNTAGVSGDLARHPAHRLQGPHDSLRRLPAAERPARLRAGGLGEQDALLPPLRPVRLRLAGADGSAGRRPLAAGRHDRGTRQLRRRRVRQRC